MQREKERQTDRQTDTDLKIGADTQTERDREKETGGSGCSEYKVVSTSYSDALYFSAKIECTLNAKCISSRLIKCIVCLLLDIFHVYFLVFAVVVCVFVCLFVIVWLGLLSF